MCLMQVLFVIKGNGVLVFHDSLSNDVFIQSHRRFSVNINFAHKFIKTAEYELNVDRLPLVCIHNLCTF